MKDLQKELEQAQIRRNTIFTDIESLRLNESKADLEIEAIKQQIEDSKKPKLRHGECYHDGCNSLVTIKTDDGWCRLYEKEMYPAEPESQVLSIIKTVGYKPTGFMFPGIDDLKALQEDVTEFENRGTTFRLSGCGELVILTPRGVGYVDLASVSPLIRQMQATMERAKK